MTEKWKIFYYLNGKILKYCSENIEWNKLPPKGVQVFLKYTGVTPDQKELITGCDAYIIDD